MIGRYDGSGAGTLFRSMAVGLALIVGLGACSDDSSPTDSGDALTQAEVEVMMEAMAAAGGAGFVPVGMGAAEAAGALSGDQQFSFDETTPCSQGGSVNISGTMSFSEGHGNVNLDMTQVHQDCVESAPSDGSIWTFNGSPSIQMTLSGTVSEDHVDIQGNQQGGISWSSDGRSGTCNIDVSYSLIGDEHGGTATVNGSVCGVNISQTHTVTGP